MQSQIKWFLIIVIVFFSPVMKLKAQQQDLNVTVTTDVTQLSADQAERLANFKNKVESYMNKAKYHDEKIPPINVQMQFTFTSVNNSTLTYNAKLFIASQREVYNPFNTAQKKYTVAFRFLDERCEFVYNENIPFIKNDLKFDSFLSLLDYYAYMIVGYDEDSYNPKGGSKYFQKAADITNKVVLIVNGWTETGGGSKPSRQQLVQELLNVRFNNFRLGYFEYMYTGLDSMSMKKKIAQNNVLDALTIMSRVKKSEVKSFNIDLFLDAKAPEIAEIFLDYGDKTVYDRLGMLDPAHQGVYIEAKKKAL